MSTDITTTTVLRLYAITFMLDQELLTMFCLQPLMQRKQEHEKKRKELKEQWLKAKRKLVSTDVSALF